MLKKTLVKLKEGFIAIIPVYLIILICSFIPGFNINLTKNEYIIFTIGTVIAGIGLTLFNIGSEIAMDPIGKNIGSSLTKKGKITLLLVISFLLGFLLTASEPDIAILANQLKSVVSAPIFIIIIALGVGFFLIIAILRIIFKIDLSKIFLFSYLVMFVLAILLLSQNNAKLIPFIMDSGGVTTGPITVPFMMALSIGISSIVAKRSEKDIPFGLMGICSVGAIIFVLLLGLNLNSNNMQYTIPNYEITDSIFKTLMEHYLSALSRVVISIILITITFFIFNAIFLKLPKKKVIKIFIGIIYLLIGLILFLGSVESGFIPIGFKVGQAIASNKVLTLIFTFISGALCILAEPAVAVLNNQIADVTGGVVKKRTILIGLMIGVAISLTLCALRIYYQINLFYFLIPGFIICLLLTFFIPKVYTAIAFDSGGVAAGAMTSSFMLPLSIGICTFVFNGLPNMSDLILEYAFGVVAIIALTPVIIIELIGLKQVIKNKIKLKKYRNKLDSLEDDIFVRFDDERD